MEVVHDEMPGIYSILKLCTDSKQEAVWINRSLPEKRYKFCPFASISPASTSPTESSKISKLTGLLSTSPPRARETGRTGTLSNSLVSLLKT
jgi:hypothetical protein